MRLLHVTDTFLPRVGGAEIAIDQLARAMMDRGAETAVLAQRVKGHRREIDAPYPLHRYRNPQSSRWAGWWVERHIRHFERQLGEFDIYIGHHAFPPGYACVKHSRRFDRPSIVYPRGGDIYEVSRFRRKPAAWRKLSWALANASAVICASQSMENLVRQIVGISAAEGRIVRIPNGVNIEELGADASASPLARDSGLAGQFVLGLGRAIRRKGFHLLIEAFGRHSMPGWKLVIAGDGRDLEALRAQAHSLGDRVVFTGLVTGADKRWLLQHCQFMVAPSLEESFGNVALEAMACGKPVIASRASGFAEIVHHGENGMLVEVGNASALSDAMQGFMERDLSGLSQGAKATAGEFSWHRIADKYLELADQLVKTWRAASRT